MTDETKFCKDCKYFEDAGAISFFGIAASWPASCNQPPERDLIFGRKKPASPERMRATDGNCKPAGLLWEKLGGTENDSH